MKNILVTGGTGFVGLNLIKKLAQLDLNIKATYLTRNPNIFKM